MFSGNELYVFHKYQNAGSHAFSAGVVTDEDKDVYQEIFFSLTAAAQRSNRKKPTGHLWSWPFRYRSAFPRARAMNAGRAPLTRRRFGSR